DSNANGIKDDGDFNRGDIVVKLLNPDGSPALDDKGQAITTVTDNQGNYSFFNLKPGSNQVMFVAPEGFTFTTANTGSNDAVDSDAGRTGITQTVVIKDGDFNSTLNAGLVRPAGIGNFVFEDKNGNGIQDNGEIGISGATVTLLADTDNDGQIDDVVKTETTDSNGFYEFTGLTPGDYKVQFAQPNGFDKVSPFKAGFDATKDSNANPNNNLTTDVITLLPGRYNDQMDAGFYKSASLGNRVWYDNNRNGIQDAGERGIKGVKVTLTGGGADGKLGNADDTTAFTFTDRNGNYLFKNLSAGEEYQVTFDLPDTKKPTRTDQVNFQHRGLSENFEVDGDLTNLMVGDFDGDGKDDFIRQEKGHWARDRWNMTDVFFSKGNGTFKKKSLMQGSHYLNGNLTNLLVGDFNGDGKDDFIRQEKGHWARDRWNMTDIFFSNGNGTFKKKSLMQGSHYLNGDLTNLIVGDFNGDGKDDFIRQEKGHWARDRWNMTDVFFSNGNGTFRRQSLMQGSSFLNGNLTNLIVGDFNGDGKDDFMRQEKGHWANDRVNMNQIFFSNGNGTFEKVDVLKNTGLLNGNLTNVLTGDFNGNGKDGFIRQEKGYWDDDRIFTADVYLNNSTTTQAQAYAFTPQNVGSNDAVDSDTNPTTGMTQIVTLASGANNSTLDTGIYKKPQYSVNFNFVHSPIALDLTGDGIQTISIDEGVTFDMLETGNAVNTGWLSGEDGFLAVDNNGDGLISSRGELFGGLVGEGFAKLESFDTNGDGLVNEADDLFADLRLWQDINQNGVTDSGELVNLATAGITDLVTGHTDVFSTDAAGNIHGEHSFAKRNGSTIDMVDVYFQVNG
ncbi:MAG: SdrD B-like domain-containing protein, partial [Cyanobacteria bacterium P01_D01_bin.156]